jgi:hypothetical protein
MKLVLGEQDMVTTPQLSDLATRIAAPARLLATRLGHIARPAQAREPVPTGPAGAVLGGRLHAPVLDHSPESLLWAETEARFAAMAAGEHWGDLLAMLARADHERTAAPGGRRLASLISAGARAVMTERLARRDWSAALTEIDRLAELQSVHGDDAMVAHLLAQAHIDYGWARRSAEPGPGVPRDVWQDFLHHTALAEAALGGFDPIEEDSPLLAGTRYLLVRGIEDGDTLCRDWYEDWSDLDPTNAEPHLTHAPHLLPQWFGTLSDFDDEARAALYRTHHCSNASAYALFHLAAIDALGDLPAGADVELFMAGLIDYFHATGCQYRANVVAAALTDLHHSLGNASPGSKRRQAVQEALDEHLRDNLREFHLSAWDSGASLISYALGVVFEKELAHGDHIHLGPEGLVARHPV